MRLLQRPISDSAPSFSGALSRSLPLLQSACWAKGRMVVCDLGVVNRAGSTDSRGTVGLVAFLEAMNAEKTLGTRI